eukprot:CAMPEP_0202791616 /NCGR_PEP_ID=MMETSP1388-20130828/81953_1 /ASSEMBLY_ACC=CAM_ASM_000864 /TAXON_ID=37098 /ORGANISM="Isochrysis sp, Strain CCMP1244" /LENGTH=54 /DNA_ID=CAMNT_0049461383 /DNA_START=103 /DNA_END=263 /DNA_ORIENTATION=+
MPPCRTAEPIVRALARLHAASELEGRADRGRGRVGPGERERLGDVSEWPGERRG